MHSNTYRKQAIGQSCGHTTCNPNPQISKGFVCVGGGGDAGHVRSLSLYHMTLPADDKVIQMRHPPPFPHPSL